MDLEQGPLYVRWNAERLPFAIEIKLDAIARMAKQIESSQEVGIEVGGILIGAQPNAHNAIFRIDDFQITPRRLEDGAVFMLDPREHDRFATARWETKTDGRATVGFFRTHRRSGPLCPSLADRALLTDDLIGETCAVLLIEGAEPYTAALFVGTGGELPEAPSVREFRFDDKAFRALPEIGPDSAESSAESVPGKHHRSLWGYLAGVLALLLAMAAALYLLMNYRRDIPKGINLTVAGNQILTVTWNHSSPELQRATSAKLIVADGQSHREVTIGPDELTRGSLIYERLTGEVQVTLVLQMPGAVSVIQSATWHS